MKLPALIIGTAMFMSMFIFSSIPIFDTVDNMLSDNATGWGEESRVTDNRMASFDPVVKDDGLGNTHIIWTGEKTGTPQLYYAKYDQWGRPIISESKMTKNGAPSGAADMAVGPDGMVTIAFVDGREGNWNIFIKMIDANGVEVTPAIQVSQIPLGSTAVGIVNNIGGPGTNDLDQDRGPEASQTVQTLTELKDMTSFKPSVRVDQDGDAHVVWADSRNGNFELYYSQISQNGDFEVSELRLTETPSSSLHPLMALGPDGTINIVWEETRGDTTRIEYMLLGSSHTKLRETRLVTTTHDHLVKDLAVDDDGVLHLVWSDEKSGSKQIRYQSFEIGGAPVWPETALTPPGGEGGNPTIAVDGDLVHIIFTHGVGSTGNEIYYKTIDPETGNISLAAKLVPNAWGARDLDLDWAPVALNVDTGKMDGRLRLVWADSRDGSDDIFLTHAETQYFVEVESSVVETGTETTTHPVTFAAVGGLFALGLAFATDIGKWAIGSTFLPMYSRLKRTNLLDQSVRDQIYNHVLREPGVNFTGLMRALDLKNGVLSYHLATLEREEYIVSRRDGIYRRYYPRTNGYNKAPKELHEVIIDTIFERPGITQSQLAKALKKSRQVINYHIKQLISNGTIKLERKGRQTKCYVNNWTI